MGILTSQRRAVNHCAKIGRRMRDTLLPNHDYTVRAAGPEDAAALFIVHAAITAADAGQLLSWTEEMEERLETGGHAWIIGRDGRKPVGYALIDPVSGLPGIYDLSGGIVPTGRRRGQGTSLLRHVQHAARALGVRQLSVRVVGLEDETAAYLLRRGFVVEHEECLLQLGNLSDLPLVPDNPPGHLVTYPRDRAIAEFCRLYDDSFSGAPWSQPYTEAEVAALLYDATDLLFIEVESRPVGVAWCEALSNGRGRVEPLGIARAYQGLGYGRRLLLGALHHLRRRAYVVEIGTWRQNSVALNLYKGLGFREVDRWYYLACELDGLKAE